MAEDKANTPGDYYYGNHDDCLYHVTYSQGKMYLARCCNGGPTPAADQFCEPYEMLPGQLDRLLRFNCWERADYQPAPAPKPAKEKAKGTLSLF